MFLLASFPEKETNYRKQADWYRMQFERALDVTVRLSDGMVRREILRSGEAVTEYTEKAERQTQKLIGIPIDSRITRAEERLRPGGADKRDSCPENRRLLMQVRNLNRRVLVLLEGLISLKERILADVESCRLYTSNYPLLIEHILREARWYRQRLGEIEQGCAEEENQNMEAFWNQIMMEHAEFIRGLLDPTECELINTANDFAREYGILLETAVRQDSRVREELTGKNRETTEKYRDFKAAGTKGITGCSVRSVILPLLADHVLREANHYLRLLEEKEKRKQSCK